MSKLERLIMDKRTNLFELNEDEEEVKKFIPLPFG
jgi:hypothetical protein